MFEGKRFLPETGTPMRNIACTNRLFALAEPVPLTLASLIAKSFTRRGRSDGADLSLAVIVTSGRRSRQSPPQPG